MSNIILLVDDNEINRHLLNNILSDDYTIVEAADGLTALDCLHRLSTEIVAIILDIEMPVMNGYAVLEAIRNDPIISHIPVIVSTDGSDTDELKALKLGAIELIGLPYNAQTVRQRINNIVRLVRFTHDVDALRISEERYRVAASAGGRVTATYDIVSGLYYKGEKSLTNYVFGDVIGNVPQSLIDNGLISHESITTITTLFNEMGSGAKSCSANISIRIDEDTYRWFKCEATIIFGSFQKPSQAIIVYTDITENLEKEAVYLKWQQSLRQKSPDNFTQFHCNLSRDLGFETVNGQLLQNHIQKSNLSFNEQARAYANEYVHPDERDEFLALMNAEMLLANYYRNHRMQAIEFRELYDETSFRWLRLAIELVEFPNSTDIGAYCLFEDINDEKLAALRVKELAERDPLTGVLNRTAFAQAVAKIISTAQSTEHAFIILDIDHFKQLNDTFGHAAGDQELIDIAKSLRTSLRHGDLLGRLGGDEFLVFLKDIPYDAVIEKKARQICAFSRKSFSADVKLSASVGIAVYPRDGDCFDTLYHNADAALYTSKDSGRDTYTFYKSEMDANIDAAKSPKSSQPVVLGGRPLRRMLIVDDSKINREMLTRMFCDKYSIETANDGNMAIARMKHFGTSIAIVLLDIVMPGLDGFAVLDEIRNSIELKSIPIIVVSGHDDQDLNLRAIKAGAADFITKPVDPDLLRLRVESAVSKAESERLRAQNSYLLLQNSEEEKYRTVLESTGTVVIEYDWTNGVYVYDRSIKAQIAGDFDNRRLWQIMLSDLVADTQDVKRMQELVHEIANDRSRIDGEVTVKLKTPTGRRQWFRMRVFKRVDEYQLTNRMIITFNNINDEVVALERLRYQAERDDLTGLWNRKTFFEKSSEIIRQRPSGFYCMVVFDISGFKVINDQFGTEKGDEILKNVGAILRDGFANVHGIVGRISSDEFAVLCPASVMCSNDINSICREASLLDGSIPPISFSIGQYYIDDLSLTVSAMYDRAILAQESVKGRYDINIACYGEPMRCEMLRQQKITSEMKSALESGQFETWFQPQYDHFSGESIGAEALVRWRHPERGIIYPCEFIPIFERNGFVYELDRFVWEQVCSYLRKWLDDGRKPHSVAVNISRFDLLTSNNLCGIIVNLLHKYALPIELLRLEITESAFSKDTQRVVSVVKELITKGFTVEIDDFGSGYSSFNTLKDVPAQVLKMDMRFLERNLGAVNNSDTVSPRSSSIMQSIVRMANWLGMTVIAEGVETKEQADYLISIGCNFIQGYFYARPMTANDYEKHSQWYNTEEQLLEPSMGLSGKL